MFIGNVLPSKDPFAKPVVEKKAEPKPEKIVMTLDVAGEEKKALEIYKRINTTPEQKRKVNKLAKAIIPSGAKTGKEKIEL